MACGEAGLPNECDDLGELSMAGAYLCSGLPHLSIAARDVCSWRVVVMSYYELKLSVGWSVFFKPFVGNNYVNIYCIRNCVRVSLWSFLSTIRILFIAAFTRPLKCNHNHIHQLR